MIRFKCPHCEKVITVKDELAGRKAKCPGCQGILQIPGEKQGSSQIIAPRPATPAVTPRKRLPEPDREEIPEVEAVDPDEEEIPEVEAVEADDDEAPPRRRRAVQAERPRRRRDEEEEDEEEEEKPRRRRRRRRAGPYADCPNCGAPGDATRVWYTLWGGFIGPLIINHVRCNNCGETYNGRTGDSNNTRIIIFVVVCVSIGLVLGVIGAITEGAK